VDWQQALANANCSLVRCQSIIPVEENKIFFCSSDENNSRIITSALKNNNWDTQSQVPRVTIPPH